MFTYVFIKGKAKLQRYFGDQRGQGITEYAAILAVVVGIALFLGTGEKSFSTQIGELYTSLSAKISEMIK